MSIDLNILTEKDYIHATATGSFDMEDAGSHIKEVISRSFTLGKRKIVVDFSQLEGEIFPIQVCTNFIMNHLLAVAIWWSGPFPNL